MTQGAFAMVDPDVYEEDQDQLYNPRENDNLGTMVCFHAKYILGDKHEYKTSNYSGWDDMYEGIIADYPNCVILPIYMYDHGGISLSIDRTYPYNDSWDSGQVGYIFASRKAMLDSFGATKITKAIKEKTREVLKAEVEEYSKYLGG